MYNTYGQRSKSFGVPVQVWLEVNGVKSGGGIVAGFDNLPVGAVIPAGTAVHLDKSGGTLTPVRTFEVSDAATTTKVKVWAANHPYVGEKVMLAPSALDGTGTGFNVSAVGAEVDGKVELTLNASITAAVGDILVSADKQGADAAIAAIPNGLLRHDIVKEEGDDLGTGACVDVGRIREDIAPTLPEIFKEILSDIKFEKGV